MQTVTATAEDGTETKKDVVSTVNYIDHSGALKGLTFPPAGTALETGDDGDPRIVGQDVPVYEFDTPEAAVTAYEHGQVL